MRFARFISVVGHPLLTIPLFAAIVMFKFNDLKTAAIVTFLIIGCVFVPMILIMYFKSRNGSYTNFDVSDKKQRRSLFFYAVPLLLVVTIILFKTEQTLNLCISVLFAQILLIISQVINYFVKSSMHVSFNIYLAALIFTFDYKIGIAVLLLPDYFAGRGLSLTGIR